MHIKMISRIRQCSAVFMSIVTLTLAIGASNTFANENPRELPRASVADILNGYQGSFRIDHSDGVSRSQYVEGRVAINPANNSVFFDSNHREDAVAEFRIPENLSTSSDPSDLPMAQNLQGYRSVLTATDTGIRNGTDKIGGMAMIDGELFIQAYNTYDASHSVTHTTAVVRDPSNLSGSNIDGLFQMQGVARVVNYISPIPVEWQGEFNSKWLAGNGAGMSINSRFSEGPSLYTFDPSDFTGEGGVINTRAYLDYPFRNALSSAVFPYEGEWDAYNDTRQNRMWTQASSAYFGFIIPQTRTFAVIGKSGMLREGGGYKIVNDEGYLCGGPCPYDNEDSHSFYWLYDLNDILDARNTYDPIPYDYGIFDDRYVTHDNRGSIGGPSSGTFDPASGTLIICSDVAGRRSGDPVCSVYQVNASGEPVAVAPEQVAAPNPALNLNVEAILVDDES